MKKNPQLELLEAVEALCAVWCGKAAEGEQWGETCRRLEALNKIAKKARKSISTAEGRDA